MTRWLGVDHGTKRIGLAVGGTEDKLATGVSVIGPHGAIEQIKTVAAEYDAVGIVVGWPLNMDDTEGPQGLLARTMAAELAEACQLDVRMWDERLSSFTADQALAGSYTRKKRRARQDALAAAIILQDFLCSDGPNTALHPTQCGPL